MVEDETEIEKNHQIVQLKIPALHEGSHFFNSSALFNISADVLFKI